jgi:hypothetical protein
MGRAEDLDLGTSAGGLLGRDLLADQRQFERSAYARLVGILDFPKRSELGIAVDPGAGADVDKDIAGRHFSREQDSHHRPRAESRPPPMCAKA